MKIFLAAVLFLFVNASFAQETYKFLHLNDIRLKSTNDFIEQEENLIKAVDYLLETTYDKKNIDRALCGVFIIRYAEGCSATISLSEKMIAVSKKNEFLLFTVMGLWVKEAINNKDQDEDHYKEYVFTELAKYCEKDTGIKKDKMIKSLIAAYKEEAIEDWMSE